MKMRRLDREVTKSDEKLEIISRCKVCRLAMIDETVKPAEPYIVPLNFGYEYAGGILYLYFHSAGEGRKIGLLKSSALPVARPVCFEMDGGHQLVAAGPQDCDYGFLYESVIGKGTVEFVEDREEKIHGLKLLMRQQTGEDREFAFGDAAVNAITIFRLRVEEWSAKRH
ncbi:MAG: pyridoxamine 5'-phosphate oxidase family protein [Treponema sp.]|jgi:nitroimidazol reductase NimA-like FMN-containing flavoprotein (pyridoxamine 5'-phosphate oxidase superfamily)|nr:pyridoxamine 5'-phosphate oxidase family protein [Treponema sp.]